ncbi:MAG: M1 family metallopeptidase [Nitrososphaerales archaeon]
MEIKSYDLDLDVDFRKSIVEGSVVIKVKSVKSPFKLDAAGMKIRAVTIGGRMSRFSHDSVRGKLTIPGVPRKESEVGVKFTKHVRDDVIFGLYKSKYGKEHLLVTDLEPAEARTVFPCVDEPSYKAVFRLHVVTDEGLSVISNTRVASKKTNKGRVSYSFEPTPRMSTYLFFMGIGRFEEATTMSGKVSVIAASRPGQGKDSGFIRETSAAVLKDYEGYFGIPYPLSKLHLVALPEYHTGAMENWGAITSREPYVIVRSDASDSDRRNAARVMAHEIAHQWFGDLVTMKWWDDVWLNESFATFMEAKVLDRLHPDWDTWRDFLRMDTFRSLNADALSQTHPIQVKVKSVEEIGSIFDAISYGKGASVLRMLESYVGEEAFRKGVSAYLKRFSYSNASGADLWTSLAKASGLPVTRVARAWITKPGFPLVRVEASEGGVSFSQSKFSLSGKKSDELWPIPLTLQADGKRQSLLFDRRSASVKAERPEKLLVNPRRTGFYSVLYGERMYDQLAKSFAALHSHDRAGVLNDLYLFLQAGMVLPRQYFRFAALSGKVVDPLLALAVSDHLVNLRAIADDSDIVMNGWSAFFTSQVRLLGLARKQGENENLGMVREVITAQLVKTDERYARKLAQRFDQFTSADANLKTAIATAYAAVKGEAAFGPLLELVRNAKSEADRARVYAALTSFEDPALVRRTLELTISGEVSRSDTGYALPLAASNPRARGALWEWIKSRYDRLRGLYGGSQQFYLYLNAVLPRCGIGHEADVRRFISGKRYRDGEMIFHRAFELLDVNSRLRDRLLTT